MATAPFALHAEGCQQVFADTATLERPIIDPAATDLMGLLNTNNYPKGAWVFTPCAGWSATRRSSRGSGQYYKTYRDSTALSSQFAAVMDVAAGTSLTWYFTRPSPNRAIRFWTSSGSTTGKRWIL
jgi:hypothetical protein